ncbi:MAG: polyphosphate polymerase domain-containing protein [Bacteroidales bacterium]|nr:polyphosphate polymerase domain-containing protein [Bacteroidales bacterium]
MLADTLARMQPITLEEMDSIKLMNRIDTKFVTSRAVLEKILEDALAIGYRVCEIDGERLMGYDSMYYDLDNLGMYIAHHNGKKTRQKVRVRQYKISGITYLEIKRKNNKGRTKKKRIQVDPSMLMNLHDGAPEDVRTFLAENSWFTVDQLTPACTTNFNRITLVNPGKTERLTIDMDLSFSNARSGITRGLDEAVIIELKQDGRLASQMKGILLERRVHPYRVSKYCIGTALTSPGVKVGRFNQKIIYIEKQIGHKLR